MVASIVFESRKWIVAESSETVEITDLLAEKAKATKTLTGPNAAAFAEQWNEKAPEDRHDLITEWYHG